MADDSLTRDERELLYSWRRTATPMSWLGYYIAILVPMTAFALYGIAKRDVVAVGIAFGGLLLYSLWNIASQFGRGESYRRIAAKLIAREEARDAGD
jgi:hypothetical protein